jgi:hypothetical protein
VLTAYVAITVLAAFAFVVAAGFDFVRAEMVTRTMARTGVPESWLTPLGILKAMGALGLLVGFVAPPVGIAAAVGLILFFVGAIVVHLRGHLYAFTLPMSFLALALAALALRLASM